MTNGEAIGILLAVAADARDAEWYKSFESALLSVHIRLPDPDGADFFTGPDQLKYWQLEFGGGEGSTSFKAALPQLAELGCGVVISSGSSHYVLHYGDLWSMHEYGFFFKSPGVADAESVPSDQTRLNLFRVSKATRIMIGCPSDHYLPHYVKKNIAEGLKQFGIAESGVASVYIRDLNPRQNLVFAVKAANFKTPAEHQAVMGFLAWSLPKHYGLLWNEIEDEKQSYLVGDADFYPLA